MCSLGALIVQTVSATSDVVVSPGAAAPSDATKGFSSVEGDWNVPASSSCRPATRHARPCANSRRSPFAAYNPWMRPLLIAAALTLLSSAALAQAPAPAPPAYDPRYSEPPHPRRVFALTISPIHLIFPVLELTGEFRAHDKVGVAVVAGGGKYTDKNINLSASVYEVGAQVRFYLLGDFRHGMQLGAELLYLKLTTTQIVATGEGLAMGPFLGYKFTADAGFTFDTQLGFEYVGARATATNGTTTGSASESSFIPLLNINIGWSC